MSTVFSIDKTKVRQSFSSAAKSYDGLASLQRKVAVELLAGKSEVNIQKSVVDVGCGTGFLTEKLITDLSLRNVVAIDIAMPMLQTTKKKLRQYEKLCYICADAEFLPFQEDSIDRIFSNLALQWCTNLADVFNGFNKVLSQKGVLCFSTFGPATLQELKQAWLEVDDFNHVNDFCSAEQLSVFLTNAGFVDIQVQTKQYLSNYQSVMALMRELKGIGAHNNLAGRNRNTTRKSDLQRMISNYEKKTVNECISATYEVFFVTAKVA